MSPSPWKPEQIRKLRGKSSRAEFARRLGVSPLTVYRWELPDDAEEARRPRGKVAERLEAWARGEQVAMVAPATDGAGESPEALEPLLPPLERLSRGEFSRAESDLLQLMASGQLRSPSARAMAAQGLARIQLWCRADVRGAFTSLMPLLGEVEAGRLTPEVELEVQLTAALVFSSLDGRFFDAGKANAHLARAERLLQGGAGSGAALPRSLIWLAQVTVGYVLNDPALIELSYGKGEEMAQDFSTPLLRCYADEVHAVAAQLSGHQHLAARHLGEMVQRAESHGFHLLQARALAQAARQGVDDGEAPERIEALVHRVESSLRQAGVVSGWHSLFVAYAKGELLFRQGQLAHSEAVLREGLQAAEEIRWPLGTLPFYLMRSLLLSGKKAQLREVAQRTHAFHTQVFPEVSRGLGQLAMTLADLVDQPSERAVDELDALVKEQERMGAWSFLRRNLLLLNAAAAHFAGSAEQADRALRRAERGLEAIPSVWSSACLHWLGGLRSLKQGKPAEARTRLEGALEVFARAQDRVMTAFAQSALRQACLALGEKPEQLPASGPFAELGLCCGEWFEAQLSQRQAPLQTPREAPGEAWAASAPPLDRVALALQRVMVRGMRPSLIHQELVEAARQLLPGASIRLDEMDSRGQAHPVGKFQERGAFPEAWVEFGDGSGRRFRLGATGPTTPQARTVLSTLGQVAGLSLEVASLRGLTDRAPSPGLGEGEVPELPGFVSASVAMRRLKLDLARLSRSRATVIITGESGSGKEVVARAIHDLSSRAARPYVAFNCAAIPRDLFEGQLFGYRKGAFTGAVSDHPGVIRAAEGGTLFLDEVGELPLEVQPKLLRFLENGEVFPLGERKPMRVDVRVVAATFRDLEKQVREGRFREDLFFRLQVVPIRVPPLRERPEDTIALARHFLHHFTPAGQEPPVLSAEALAALTAHPWPGNVRELRNVVERSLAFEPLPQVLGPTHLRMNP